MENVILVNREDQETGLMEKMEAHKKGALHRAFSILLFNSSGNLMLQKRAMSKYHSGGLWTNTCCSHPLPGETMENATRRKLKQEMGIEQELSFAFKFVYKATLENNLIEHEMDHVFIGMYDGNPRINTDEVEDWKFISMDELRLDLTQNPDRYTTWFRLIVDHPQFKS
jgi:isopentenyl-diphosphate Delta-isomerase